MNTLEENTFNQLVIRGKLGIKRYDEVLFIDEEQAKQIIENNEIVYFNKHQIEEHDVKRMLYKREEISDITPFGVYIENIDGTEVMSVQEVWHDTIKAKFIGPKEDIDDIIGRKRLLSTCESLDDFREANADMLDEVKYIKGYFNTPDIIYNKEGWEASQLEHYDNFQYEIYGSEKFLFAIYNEERKARNKRKEMERTLEYLRWKIEVYQKEVQEYGLRKIKRSIRSKERFCEAIKKFNWTDTDFLFKEMPLLSNEHKISVKRGWKVWKYLMIPIMAKRIEELEEELSEYSVNRITIDTELSRKDRVQLGNKLSFHYMSGVIKGDFE